MSIPELLNPLSDDFEICPDCEGLRWLNGDWCDTCGGEGALNKTKKRHSNKEK